jgi:hypothetical protein
MKYGLLALTAVVFSAPTAGAQGLWWVEGDRYCSDFTNRSRNGAMCGNPKKGEVEPKPTFRYQFNTPRVPFIEDQQGRQDTVPAPSDRPTPTPTTAPARGQPPRR